MLLVVAPVLHLYEPAFVAVNSTESPKQIFGDLSEVIVGIVLTPLSVTVKLDVAATHEPLSSGSLVVSINFTLPLITSSFE